MLEFTVHNQPRVLFFLIFQGETIMRMHVVFLRRSKQGLTAQNCSTMSQQRRQEPGDHSGQPFLGQLETEAQGEDETCPRVTDETKYQDLLS